MENTRDWWTATLLGQRTSAHPIFGCAIDVEVDGGVVTLSGTVETAEDAEELEREALSMDTVRSVVNRLSVTGPGRTYHFQTVIAVFPDKDSGALACQATAYWTVRDEQPALLLEDADTARAKLQELARGAQVPADSLDELVDAVACGKVLLVDRVREDDALRLISELEGSAVEKIRTLPPETVPAS